jgi:hypothetical protein
MLIVRCIEQNLLFERTSVSEVKENHDHTSQQNFETVGG